jgi:hypothetical protein
LQKNADGSVLRAESTAGRRIAWLPTKAGGQFEVLFRLYGLKKQYFDRRA